jgi:hypothetical protein
MPSYTSLQAASKDQEDEDYEVPLTNTATGPPRRYFLLFFICMMASLVFGVDMGWQLSAHYATKEQHLSRPSGLLSGYMNYRPSISVPCLRADTHCRSRWS